jgi:hypothetical protein
VRTVLSLTAIVVSCAAAAAAADAGRAAGVRLESPRAAEIALAAQIPDRQLAASASRTAALRLSSSWGGTFQTPTGAAVRIELSDAYPQDPAIGQRWADFLDSLVHGSELETVTVYIAPAREVETICGAGSLACYSPDRMLVVTPGEDPSRFVSAEAVLTHEYGHHVAANRFNPPWTAIDWGTKRWASYEQICAKERANEVFPGAEDAFHYPLNPGEGFAESYRVLNERRAGVPEAPWDIVDRIFYPDNQALALLQQDVLSPWTQNRQSVLRGSFTKAGPKLRAFATTAAFDGGLEATLRAPARARLSLALLNSAGRVVKRSSVTSQSASVSATICGSRSFRLRVTRVSGAGKFQVTVSRP